jgi:hypothetical protein
VATWRSVDMTCCYFVELSLSFRVQQTGVYLSVCVRRFVETGWLQSGKPNVLIYLISIL